MVVQISIYHHKKYDILKRLTDELKKKHPINIEDGEFYMDVELNVTSFDEVIALLAKYDNKIETKLIVYDVNTVWLSISKRECSFNLGNQVE